MTVLVGVLCEDGVVVGSDSSATFSVAPGLNTIEQPVQKTFIVGNDVAFAITGSVGLGQRLEHLLSNLRRQSPDWHNLPRLDIVQTVTRRMIENMQTTFLKPGQLGALLAFACQDGFHLCEFALSDFQPEMKTADTWFVSMGSGQMITDPFFGLLRRTLFRDARPTLMEGMLAAYWALHNAIDLNTGGINGPVQLAVLRRTGEPGSFEAQRLSQSQLDEHRAAVEAVEKYLADGRPLLRQPATIPPTPPST